MTCKPFLLSVVALASLGTQSADAVLQISSESHVAPAGGAVHDPFQPIFTGGGTSSLDLLQGKLPSASTGTFTEEQSAGPAALTEGTNNTVYAQGGNPGDMIDHAAYATGGAGRSLTYALGGVYDLQEIVVFGGWNDGGRDAQHYNILTSSNGGGSFSLLGTFDNGVGEGGSVPIGHRVEFNDSLGGDIATSVTHLRFDFLSVENGWTGYSEIDVVGMPIFPIGDADRDFDVDIDDFYLISDNFLTVPSAAGLDGDVDVSNFVNAVDFRLWKDNAPAAALAQLAGLQVPEPSALALVFGMLLFGGRQYGRRR